MNVAILGASPDPERYSHKAQVALAKAGHEVFPVTRDGDEILGVPSVTDLSELSDEEIDTLTVYVRPAILLGLLDEVRALNPRRIILNPGTEDPQIASGLEDTEIAVVEACTLVLLQLGTF